MDKATAQAAEYAGLISDICKIAAYGDHFTRQLEQRVFQQLGFDTTVNGRGYCIRRMGESHWQTQPQILRDFGTAVHYTIGHRLGGLDHPLEKNWYIKDMCETAELGFGQQNVPRIAAWAIRLGKLNSHSAEATAITPAAALVAAWLRAHP